MHLLVTRPEQEARTTQHRLETMGHRVTRAPLLRIVYDAPPLDLAGLQAVIVTSRNAVRALQEHPDRDRIATLPMLAVGSGTGEAARNAGFTVIAEGVGGGAALAERTACTLDPKQGTILYACGDVVAFDLTGALAARGFSVRPVVVYRSVAAQSLPEAVGTALRAHSLDAVLLMSPRTSQVWVHLIQAAGLEQEVRHVAHLCLSEAVAAPIRQIAGPKVQIAVQPNSEEILALVEHLSSTSGR